MRANQLSMVTSYNQLHKQCLIHECFNQCLLNQSEQGPGPYIYFQKLRTAEACEELDKIIWFLTGTDWYVLVRKLTGTIGRTGFSNIGFNTTGSSPHPLDGLFLESTNQRLP